MTDAELIAAVAKKAGWTNLRQIPPNQWNVACWFGILPGDPDKGLRSEMPPWLTSVDACLELLEPEGRADIDMHWFHGPQTWRVIYRNSLGSGKSLPRAILLAWLEA